MKKISTPGKLFFSVILIASLAACSNEKDQTPHITPDDSATIITAIEDTINERTAATPAEQVTGKINTGSILPDSIMAFAKTLLGIPYLYASADPEKGFDCSGFITYVFNHYGINVPRSSVDFTDYGREIDIKKAKPGDLILFTGTDSTIRVVGHMGIVAKNENDSLQFIHSTSGKAKGVVITPFEKYYQSRFVKVIRVFPDELFQ